MTAIRYRDSIGYGFDYNLLVHGLRNGHRHVRWGPHVARCLLIVVFVYRLGHHARKGAIEDSLTDTVEDRGELLETFVQYGRDLTDDAEAEQTVAEANELAVHRVTRQLVLVHDMDAAGRRGGPKTHNVLEAHARPWACLLTAAARVPHTAASTRGYDRKKTRKAVWQFTSAASRERAWIANERY